MKTSVVAILVFYFISTTVCIFCLIGIMLLMQDRYNARFNQLNEKINKEKEELKTITGEGKDNYSN